MSERMAAGVAMVIAVLSIAWTSSAQAQQPAADTSRLGRPALQATRALQPPVLDGRFDDEVWQRAAVATDFRQRSPRPGEAATERTEARVAYDDEAIYVAIEAWDSAPDSIASQLARRDATGIFSDWVDVIIDSFHDRRSAYRFSVNPRGVKKDVFHFNDGSEDLSWDAVWDVATRIHEGGWSAEFRIPLSQLRFAPAENQQTWGLQFGRIIARRDEVSFWSPVQPNSGGFISLAGTMTGIQGLRSPKRLEVLPYMVGRVTRAPQPVSTVPNPFWQATQPAASFGADLRYGLTSNLTLTATLNPDFGQVEADPAVVNLSAFETFYPERRPFFLEGASLFAFDMGDDGSGEGLFYSRRIGRAPQRTALAADHLDMPESARILGAGKLTGRVRDWSVGVFNAVTRAEHAQVFRAGLLETEPVEPLTSYAVARLNRDFRDGASTLGLLLTSTNRHISSDAFNFMRTSAYSGGLAGQHRFGRDHQFRLSGNLAASAIFGDTLAIQLAQLAPQRFFQRPDARHVEYDPRRTSLHGLAGEAVLSKVGGDWNGGLGTAFRTPGFEVNDIGFQQNGDQRFVFAFFNYHSFADGAVLRNWSFGVNPNSGWDFGGTRLWSQVNVWGNLNFANYWSANFFVNNRWDATATGALRGGPALYQPGGNNFNLSIGSDRRQRVFMTVQANGYRERGTGALRRTISGSVTARPTPRFDMSLQPSVGRNEYAAQYVAAPRRAASGDREYIVAGLDQTTVALTTRLNYTHSRNLSLQLYAQPFISSGDYDSFRRVAQPAARAFDVRFHTFGSGELSRADDRRTYTANVGEDVIRFDNPDFSRRSLRSNAVVRWEYRPGSTLFVVWSHGRSSSVQEADFDFGRSLDELRSLNGTNVLLVKLNYWLNL